MQKVKYINTENKIDNKPVCFKMHKGNESCYDSKKER